MKILVRYCLFKLDKTKNSIKAWRHKVVILHLFWDGGGGFGGRVRMIQLNEREKEYGDYHGECAGVVRISGRYEAIVLGVLQWSHRHLRGREQVGVADSIVVDYAFEHAVHVGYLELYLEVAAFLGKSAAHEGVQANELELHVGALEWLPFAGDHLLNVYCVDLFLLCFLFINLK